MTMFTDTALQAGIVTEYEADLIEDFIVETLDAKMSMGIWAFEPPKDLKPLWDKVCLFKCEGSLQ